MAKLPEEMSRREQILAAAVEVFSEKGFHDARVEEIARRAGIGKGTVYEYFSTKKELFQVVLWEGMEFFRREIQLEHASSDPLAVRLERIAEQQLAFSAKHRNLFKVMMNSPETVSDKAKDIYLTVREGIHSELVRLFSEAAERQEIPPLDFDTAAWMMLGAFNAIATTGILTEQVSCPRTQAVTLVNMFLNGLKNM